MGVTKRQFFSSLRVKTVFFLSVSLLVVFSLITFINVSLQEKLIFSRQVDNAKKLRELVLSAMRYPMLSGDQDVIQKQFDEYNKSLPGILGIELVDSDGIIRRSSIKSALGLPFENEHSSHPMRDLSREFMGVLKIDDRPVFVVNVPIFNEKSCYACHGSLKRILGSLHMHLEWHSVINALGINRDVNILVSLMGIALISVFMLLFFFRSFFLPLKRMHAGMQKVAEGDFSTSLIAKGSDEISSLSGMFNKMSSDLAGLMSKEKDLLEEANAREQYARELNLQLENEMAERQRVQQALFESERKFRGLIENLNVGVYRSGDGMGDNSFVEVNPALVKMLGFKSAEELKKLPIGAIFVQQDDHIKLLGLVKADGSVWDYEVRLRRKDGQTVWVSVSARGFFADHGELAWIDGIIEDISGRKLAEEKFRTAHRQLSDIIGFLPDPAFVIDREHKVIAWNRAIERLTGVRHEQILGKGGYMYSTPFYGEPSPAFVDYVLEGKEAAVRYTHFSELDNVFHAEAFVPKLFDARGAYLSINVSLLRDAEGQVTGAIETLRDITERTEFIRRIENASREWRTTFDCIPELVVMIDRELRFVRVNKPFADAMGKLPEQLVGMSCGEGYLAAWMIEAHRQAMSEGQTVMREVFDTEKARDMEITAAPIFGGERNIIGVVEILKDVSERKDLEKKQRLSQLGKLVADMAHEVNNPLMIISGNAQLCLMENTISDESRHNLNIIVDESRRAKDIIQRLLKFSRPSKGEFHPTEINRVMEGVIVLVEHQFGLSNVSIKRDYGQDIPLISADEKQLQEVFFNLLNNAKEAISEEGTIVVRTRTDKVMVKIEVIDTGRGMSDAVLKHVMEPFFTTKQHGTGLGLSVTYGIVKAHGGEIRFESVPGQGTSAIIVLPVKGGEGAI